MNSQTLLAKHQSFHIEQNLFPWIFIDWLILILHFEIVGMIEINEFDTLSVELSNKLGIKFI